MFYTTFSQIHIHYKEGLLLVEFQSIFAARWPGSFLLIQMTKSGPKWDQNGIKMGQKGDQNGIKMGSKWDQNESKWDQNRTKKGPKVPK